MSDFSAHLWDRLSCGNWPSCGTHPSCESYKYIRKDGFDNLFKKFLEWIMAVSHYKDNKNFGHPGTQFSFKIFNHTAL